MKGKILKKVFFYFVFRKRIFFIFNIENLVALHLLKRNQFLEDTEGKTIRLGYLRDKNKREIDFAIEENGSLTHLIEVKKSEDGFNPNLNYFSLRLQPTKALQLVWDLKREKDYETFEVKDLALYLSKLET